MSAGHTPGPVTYQKCACGDPICSQYRLSTQGSVGFEIGDAQLYAAAPELLAVSQNWEIKGPDDDGLVWLILHGNGTSGRAMVNLGAADRITGQVALLLEQDRSDALLKATGESSLRRVEG